MRKFKTTHDYDLAAFLITVIRREQILSREPRKAVPEDILLQYFVSSPYSVEEAKSMLERLVGANFLVVDE